MGLIDSVALIDYFKEQCEIASQDSSKESLYTLAALKCCIDLFEHFPTIDAVEVVHGRWIKKTADCVYYYACSECGEPVLRNQWGCDFFSEYCPNCGAKMDGEMKMEDG